MLSGGWREGPGARPCVLFLSLPLVMFHLAREQRFGLLLPLPVVSAASMWTPQSQETVPERHAGNKGCGLCWPCGHAAREPLGTGLPLEEYTCPTEAGLGGEPWRNL